MSIKKIFVALCFCLLIVGTSIGYQGEVPQDDHMVQIDDKNFPNDTFRAYVKTNFDTGGYHGTKNPSNDGWLGGNELTSIEKLDLSKVFDDMTKVSNDSIIGFEKFVYLEELRLGSNTAITALNLGTLTYLETLYCRYNPSLKTLNVSACTRLEDLICNNCALEGTLDLSKNTALGDLECFNNPELTVVLPKTTDWEHGNYGGVRSVFAEKIKSISPVTVNSPVNSAATLDPEVLGSNLRSFYISGLTDPKFTAVDFSNATNIEYVEMNNIANLEKVTFGSASSLYTFKASNTKLGTGFINTLAAAGATAKLSTLELVNAGGATTADLSGFNNLTNLDLSSNDLTAVTLPGDLTQKWSNVKLNFSNNSLTSLAVPTGTTHLILTNNNFTSLPTIPDSVVLLEIGGNKFTSFPKIPVTVTDLDISNFGLTEVDLSGLTNLQVLIASDNDFTSLDLTASSHLHDVAVDGNKNMTSIKLDGLTEVKRVNISGTKIPLSNVPKIVGYLYANEMDESFFGSEGAVDLSQHTNVFTLYMNDNGEIFKNLTLASSDTGYSQEYRLANNGLTSLTLPADACWITLDNNHLTTLELAQCTHLEEISFEEQTYPGSYTLSIDQDGWSMNMSDIVGSENLSKVSGVTAYASDNSTVTATNSGGVYVFSKVPSTVTYKYDTGGKMRYTGEAVLMGVKVATKAPETPTPAPDPETPTPDTPTPSPETPENPGTDTPSTPDTPDTPSTPEKENPGTNTENGGGSVQTNVTTTPEKFSAMSETQKKAVTTLKLTGTVNNLATLIEPSPNLNYLDLREAEISEVVLDSNSAPKIDTIDVSGNTSVQTVEITNGVIKNLSIAGCSSLKTLSCPRNSLMALDLNDLASLQEANFSGQTRSGITLSKNMNFSNMIENSVLSSLNYRFYAAFSPEKIKNLKAFDASGNEISTTYNNATGEVNFASIPAKFQYDYDTGFKNTLMDVTVSSSNGSSGGNSDNNDNDDDVLGSSGGGCDFGFGALIGFSLISIFVKKLKK